MGVREIEQSLKQWQMEVKDLSRKMILEPTPRERERWYAMLLLAQGWTASAAVEGILSAASMADAEVLAAVQQALPNDAA